MVFSSPVFLFLYLPLSLAVYFALPQKFRNLFLLLISLVFYAWGEPIYVFVMIFSTLMDYFAGLIIDKWGESKKVRKIILCVSIVMNLTLLGVFKYAGFILTNINSIFGTHYVTNHLLLPIGISFFTFQSMSYTIDLYKRKIKVQKNVINFSAFVTMFPQVVAGPIVRYEDVQNEIDSRTITTDKIYSGIMTFIRGMGKKVLIANNIGLLWNTVQHDGNISAATAVLGIIAFTLQIYFDFSGYSDMAVGLGLILGFKFPQNFDHPYMSHSISEFWRRWHMTLGNWFKSYVYIPLGGSRCSKARCVFNLALVWLLTGIWHGANWNFILWGCLYGVLIILEKLFLGDILKKLPAAVRATYTMVFVIMGWVLFSANDLPDAVRYFTRIFGNAALADTQTLYLLQNYGIIIIIAIFGCTDLFSRVKARIAANASTITPALPVVYETICGIGVFFVAACYLINQGYNPFLYFNF